MKLKAGIYDPYLDTLGGGERYTLTVAEILSQHNYDVDIFWSGDQTIIKQASKRFSLDLTNTTLVPDIFNVTPEHLESTEGIAHITPTIHHKATNLINKIRTTKQYDIFFYVTDGSIPIILSKKNLLHFQVPFNHKFSYIQKQLNNLKIGRFSHVVCNSKFTKSIIDKNFSTSSDVLYPPVDVAKFFNSSHKENRILSVGRFDNILNAKKQDVLIEAFAKLPENLLHQWRLILMGGSLENPNTNHYLTLLKEKAKNLPVDFVINPHFDQLQSTYSQAKIYWHAAGYQVDVNVNPEFTEHFGMAVVEAMASGQVPIIVNQGGLPETITAGTNGYLWNNSDELIKYTVELMQNNDKLQQMSKLAIESSLQFSKEKFTENLMQLLK